MDAAPRLQNDTPETRISAVIFDLDGTLLNTEQATKNVLKEILAKYGKVVDMEKENKRMGMVHKDSAIAIVKDYQLPIKPEQYSQEIMPMYKDKWLQAKALPGANRLIRHLHKNGVRFSLASNSVRKNIEVKLSPHQGWKECFYTILGSDQVKSGKPSPDIFLEAANRMGVEADACLVIEDSIIGVKAAKAAGMKVVAVPSIQNESDKYSIADSVLHSLLEFRPEIWGLPPFDDWVDNALPIEPIYLKGLFKNGMLHEFSGNGSSSLADQISGLYFGWSKFGSNVISKVVMSIKLEHSCCNSKRKIEAFPIDRMNEDIGEQRMLLLLVGFIRGISTTGCKNVEISEEDKLIASTCLDSRAFAHHTRIPFFAEVDYEDDCSL